MGGIVVGFLIVIAFVVWIAALYVKQRNDERRLRVWFESQGLQPWPNDAGAPSGP